MKKSRFFSLLLGALTPAILLPSLVPISKASETQDNPEILIQWSATNKLGSNSEALKAVRATSLKTFRTPLMKQKGKGFIEKVVLPKGSDINSALKQIRSIPGVVMAEPNQVYSIVETSNDPYYTDGSLWGMYSDDATPAGPTGTTNSFGSQAEQAWANGYIGNTKVVIGVIDTGVDYTHPDLYLNIYLNQGEIKTLSFFSSLQDVDGDGLITFRDLNNSANSAYVTDVNSNGRIDGGDLLNDSRWENGVDNDSNGYVDDLIGWDFYNNDNDPMDDHYHGTHVSGTIGGMGGNSVGVAGVNWNVLIMPLKFLNSGGSGYTDDAIQCIDYYASATQAHDKAYDPNSPSIFIGTSNSWGGGGSSTLLETSIRNGASVNNHFFAAAGNSSNNNNTNPFYPASYTTLSVSGWEAVTSVASLDSNGSISGFSNYGSTTVDIGAPGSGVMSSRPSNTYGYLSGTSMATPHVSGAVALFAASFPQADRRELREVLLSTVRPTTSLNGKVTTNGRLDVMAGLAELSTRYSGPVPSYSISGPSSVNEGVPVALTVDTTNVPDGTTLYWSISGVQAEDLNPASLQGSTTINSDSASINFSTTNDSTLEWTETLTINIYSNSSRTNLVASKVITISDTSNGLTYVWGTTGKDTLSGGSGRDSMSGVTATGTTVQALGKGQIDSVSGKGGADLFVLGQIREGTPYVFYNNGVNGSVGANDYLLITDFNKQVDRLQLTAGRYFSRNATTNTVIYWDRNNNGTLQLTGLSRDEVIAIVRGVNLGNFTIQNNSSVPWAIFNQ